MGTPSRFLGRRTQNPAVPHVRGLRCRSMAPDCERPTSAMGRARLLGRRSRQAGMLRIAAGRGWMAKSISLVTGVEDAVRPQPDGRDGLLSGGLDLGMKLRAISWCAAAAGGALSPARLPPTGAGARAARELRAATQRPGSARPAGSDAPSSSGRPSSPNSSGRCGSGSCRSPRRP